MNIFKKIGSTLVLLFLVASVTSCGNVKEDNNSSKTLGPYGPNNGYYFTITYSPTHIPEGDTTVSVSVYVYSSVTLTGADGVTVQVAGGSSNDGSGTTSNGGYFNLDILMYGYTFGESGSFSFLVAGGPTAPAISIPVVQ